MEVKRKIKKDKQIAFMVYPALNSKLQAIADKHGIPRVEVIESLIEKEYREGGYGK